MNARVSTSPPATPPRPRRALWALLLMNVSCACASVEEDWVSHEITFASVPDDAAAFDALGVRHANDPAGAAALYVLAHLLHERDPALGEHALVKVLDPDFLTADQQGEPRLSDDTLAGFRLKMWTRPYVARSYVVGTRHADGYTLPPPPWRVAVRTRRDLRDRLNTDTRLSSSGSARPRTLGLRRSAGGPWKIRGYHDLELGILPPVAGRSTGD